MSHCKCVAIQSGGQWGREGRRQERLRLINMRDSQQPRGSKRGWILVRGRNEQQCPRPHLREDQAEDCKGVCMPWDVKLYKSADQPPPLGCAAAQQKVSNLLEANSLAGKLPGPCRRPTAHHDSPSS